MPTTPIVSATLSSDPVGVGLVASLNRPGGNVTGILFTVEGLYGKQMQLARQIKPATSKIGLLVNMRNPDGTMQRGDAEAQATTLGIELLPVDVLSPDHLEAAFEQMVRERCDFALILSDAIFVTVRQRLADVALQTKMPTMFGLREFPIAGGTRQLRDRPARKLAPRRIFRRSDLAGRQAGESAGRAADKIRNDHQSENRQSARPRSAADAARARR